MATQATTSTISPKYQIVVPTAIRRHLRLKPGQKVIVSEEDGRIVLTPLLPMAELEGILRGEKLDFEREPDRI